MKQSYFEKMNAQLAIQTHTVDIRRLKPLAGRRRLKAVHPDLMERFECFYEI